MSDSEWEENTELIDVQYLSKYGYDTLTFNEGTAEAEVAVFDGSRISNVRPVSLD